MRLNSLHPQIFYINKNDYIISMKINSILYIYLIILYGTFHVDILKSNYYAEYNSNL